MAAPVKQSGTETRHIERNTWRIDGAGPRNIPPKRYKSREILSTTDNSAIAGPWVSSAPDVLREKPC